jgi:DNA-binding MarR family transcriptional regulator
MQGETRPTDASGSGPDVRLPGVLESPQAKLVYLYLATNGESNVRELATGLSASKLALYGVLSTLEDRGVVERDGERYAAR